MQEQYYYSDGSMRDFCHPRADLVSILEERLAQVLIAVESAPFALMLERRGSITRSQFVVDVHRLYLTDSYFAMRVANVTDSRLSVDSEWMLAKLMERNATLLEYEPYCRFTVALIDSLYGCAYDICGRTL